MASSVVLQDAARVVGLSTGRLRALFRRELGVSPKTYHRTLRLQEVVRLHEMAVCPQGGALRGTARPSSRSASRNGFLGAQRSTRNRCVVVY